MSIAGSGLGRNEKLSSVAQMQPAAHGVLTVRRANSAADPLLPPSWELFGLILLVIFYVVAGVLFGGDSYQSVNLLGPLALAAILSLSAFRMAQIDANAIWSALFWFRVATILYFGVGSTMPYFVNTETLLYMQGYFNPSSEQVLTFNLLIAASSLTVLAAARIAASFWRQGRYRAALSVDSPMLPIAGSVFAVIGVAVKYFILLPSALGESGDAPVSSVMGGMGLLTPVALYMLTLWSTRHRPALLPIMIIFLASQILIGLIEFNKSDVILPLLLFLLAFLSQRASIRRLALAAITIVIVFGAIVPVTEYGRDALNRRYHSISAGALDERVAILEDHYSGDVIAATGDDIQGSLARICFIYVSTFAIASYDEGRPGSSLDNIFAAVVPRVLWPDKPIISDVGIQYNVLATGIASSSSGPGLMAEAYWDFGWFGLPVMMVPLGVMLLLFSRYGMWILNTGRWGYFPLVLYVMRIGFRADGFFVLDVIGPIAFLIVLHMIFYGIELLWNAPKARRAMQ